MFRRVCICAVAAMLLGLGVERVSGQQYPSSEDLLRVKRITGVGPKARASTPIYQTSAGGGTRRPQDWHVVTVTFDTAPEWMDDLLVQFFVLSSKPDPETRQNVYSLFKKAIRYGDIERGRDRRAEAFLRPAAIRRFGDVVACAAVFTLNDRVIAEPAEQSVALPELWWRNPQVLESPSLRVREGYLLNRAESPWALIHPDEYEVIK